MNKTRNFIAGLILGVVCAIEWATPLQAQITLAPKISHVDAKAKAILDRMVEAYRRISAVSLKTEFFSETIPIDNEGNPIKAEPPPPAEKTPPSAKNEEKPDPAKSLSRLKMPRQLNLAFTRPNRIRLEMNENLGENQPSPRYQWVCDGKFFYSVIPDKNYYTREKAPQQFNRFFELRHMNFGSWDVLLLAGVDIFAELTGTMDSVSVQGAETVQGAPMDVVKMDWTSPFQEITYRFYIGKGDSLLHRVTLETRDVSGGKEPGKVGGGDPFDQLSDIVQPTQPDDAKVDESDVPLLPTASTSQLPRAFKTRLIYEYQVNSHPDFDDGAFAFTPPQGALLYGDIVKKRYKRKDYKTLAKALLAQHQRDSQPAPR